MTSYIWGIADDVLRDLFLRGKYRDVILPMTVLRRLDAVLEDTKQNVLDMKASLDKAGVVEQDSALRQHAGSPGLHAPSHGQRVAASDSMLQAPDLASLAAYYLVCLSEGDRPKASFFAKSKYQLGYLEIPRAL